MIYFFDTNILLHFLRGTPVKTFVVQRYAPFSATNKIVVSVVTLGEIRSISIQNKWGTARLWALESLYKEFIVADINAENVIQRYAEIDAYSQGKLAGKPLGNTSRNMGKNDLWIAATASILKAELITTDRDFNHLQGVFLPVHEVTV